MSDETNQPLSPNSETNNSDINQEAKEGANTTESTGDSDFVLKTDISFDKLPEEQVTSPDPGVAEPSLSTIGYNLSKFVLFIISGFILLFVIFLCIYNFDATSGINLEEILKQDAVTLEKRIEIIKLIQVEKKSCRDFSMGIAQMILLNLLLPVLTAILGYIFASNKK